VLLQNKIILMNKTLKIILNILVFALVAGFGYYMVSSMNSDKKTTRSSGEFAGHTFVSPYRMVNSFDARSDIVSFEVGVFQNWILVVLADRISVFDDSHKHLYDFSIEAGVRDIAVEGVMIYLLYPTKIISYTLKGEEENNWEACSPNSDYVAITTSENYVFVTDAENKNIVQYDKKGNLVRFIKSPHGFIIPSYAFDIININDTIYVSNSGRHRIESYTLNGKFITSFGASGAQAGAFVGCCNPVHLAKTSIGNILTSEKGNPRISSYGSDGKFRTILFDNHMLGGGTAAYRMKVSEEYIYIANKKTISVYALDTTLSEKSCNKSCGGCEKKCPKK
jgi:WD40 repeat protein